MIAVAGYLFNYGTGISGSHTVPTQLLNKSLFSSVSAGNNVNAAIAILPEGDPPKLPSIPEEIKYRVGFGMQDIYKKNLGLEKLDMTVRISGNYDETTSKYTGFLNNFEIITFNGEIETAKNSLSVLNLGSQSLGSAPVGYQYPLDTYINIYKNNFRNSVNDTWLDYYNQFLKYNLSGYGSQEAGTILNYSKLPTRIDSYTGISKFNFIYGTTGSLNGSLMMHNFKLNNLNNIQYPTGNKITPLATKAWASYDVTTGIVNNSQNVFSYAFEIIDHVTTFGSGYYIEGGPDVYAYLRSATPPNLESATVSAFQSFLGYCFDRNDCTDIPYEDVVECFSGSGLRDPGYIAFISGVKENYKNPNYKITEFGDQATSNLSVLSGQVMSGLFTTQTGYIQYNTFFTGDQVKFDLYPFDYEKLYSGYHLGNSPPYPNFNLTLTYPYDFTDIDSLVNVLNTRLQNTDKLVWYPYECLSGEFSGIYVTGGLMSFWKETGGDFNNQEDFPGLYNNIIGFKSLRNYSSGFDFRLDLVDRSEYITDLELKLYRNGWSYLIPNTVELQGLTGGQWLVLDSQTDLFHDLTGLESQKIQMSIDPTLLGLDYDRFTSGQESGSGVRLSGESSVSELEELTLSGGFELIQSFKQSGKYQPAPYCPVTEWNRVIDIITPTGAWPTGTPNGQPFDPCDPKLGGGEEEESDQPPPKGTPTVDVYMEFKRTGWFLNPTGNYLRCITAPSGDPSLIKFEKYRFVAKDFSGIEPVAENIYLEPLNEVYIKNINLWSLDVVGNPVGTGESLCLIGSDYTVDIQDVIRINIPYDFNFTIDNTGWSGVYNAFAQPIEFPEYINSGIKFVKKPGVIVDAPTGFLTDSITGSGYVSHRFTNKYFYEPNTSTVYFAKSITSDDYVTGTGQVSGEVIAIKEDIINQELLFGGRLSSSSVAQYMTKIGSGFAYGVIEDAQYLREDVPGLYNLTGYIIGLSNSGYFNYSQLFTGSGIVDGDNFPYYPVATGTIESEGFIYIDINKIKDFDFLKINNRTLTYHPNTDLFDPPDFFNNIDTLVNSLNNNISYYGVTGFRTGSSGIFLKASEIYEPGVAGNSIEITGVIGDGFYFPLYYLTGGQSFYPQLYPDTFFSGSGIGSVAATGIFSLSSGSGYVSGPIPTYTGDRYFTDIWDIQTGLEEMLSFSGNNFISGGIYYNNQIFTGVYNNFDINVFYNNALSTKDGEAIDVAQIKIKDNSFNLLANPPSGENGEFIFRITGIKTI